MSNLSLPGMSGSRADLEALWMPFTANRQFKSDPRMLVSAEGMYYTSDDGRQVLDSCAGLWCVNAGHGRRQITEAVSQQIVELDYAPPFQMGHPKAFEFANRLIKHTPGDLNHVFFTNSGSESAETALKIALAYHRLRGDSGRQKMIGRERGYHGVNFGGISVGGIANNRKSFGSLVSGVDHLPHTLNINLNAFTKGLPEHGVELADALESIITLHDASNIAAVIVEPMAGSGGVIMPPQGYLKRLREITEKHGILLIFDEVITGFGRIGEAFASTHWGVTPDMITAAKGLTNGAVPMGAVFISEKIHQTFMQGPENAIELFHGYTYSGHPVAAAAGLATLDIYEQENLFQKAIQMEDLFAEALHTLKDLPGVIDIRNSGLVAAIEFAPDDNAPGARGYRIFREAYDKGVLVRGTGDILAMSPPLIIEPKHVDQLVSTLEHAIKTKS
ncbi:aspartate aminotransferase family protein [Parendozoicomonas haliclonae]|uniref:Omega-amino acid-pyruvate aminotransferase n=1 Tax=Parendozoicomonas haliclonae TaxID=1960125 RepID=A0A1X7ART7_9GAMM|nr:aspartate aminotransferase family protein [Parendozoicomonas haliclonae]SMA50800.1 Omega-amino acid-pyruvate aminotransferase [Parendozoicomonas haliclonae]